MKASQFWTRLGVLLTLVCSAGAWAQGPRPGGSAKPSTSRPESKAPASAPIASNFDQLRVTQVADQLIRYLGESLTWADGRTGRVELAALAPVVRQAVDQHPEVRVARSQRETAAMATREANAGFLPQVSANIESGNRYVDTVNTPWANTPAHRDDSRALALSASQMVYDFGAVRAQVDGRTSLETAAAARAAARASELSLRALTAWLEVFRGRQTVSVSEMNVLSRQQILAFVTEREQLGGSSQGDVLRARARLSDAQVAAVLARNRLTAAEAQYREAFNTPPPAQLALPPAVALEPERYRSQGPALLDLNPQWLEARALTQAAQFEAKAAAAGLLPSVRLDMTARRRDIGGEGTPGTDWNAGVILKQNLYSGGSDVARKQQAEQRAVESQLNEDTVRRQLERALAQALTEVELSTSALLAHKDAVQVAAVALEAVREQFAFRRGSLLDLLRAQEELYLAGRAYIDGVVDHALSRYRLLHWTHELTALLEGTALRR